jgi:hypothetical protein
VLPTVLPSERVVSLPDSRAPPDLAREARDLHRDGRGSVGGLSGSARSIVIRCVLEDAGEHGWGTQASEGLHPRG